MEKVIVWGTGLYFEQLCERGCLKNYDIIAFCDNDISKHGNIFHGKTIIAPNEILRNLPVTFDKSLAPIIPPITLPIATFKVNEISYVPFDI